MLNYLNESNNKKETVVFIHAYGGSHRVFKKQMDSFRENFNLILVDLNGHGLSKDMPLREASDKSMAFIANEIIQILDKEGIEKAHFVGLSLGTIVNSMILKNHSDRVSSSVFLGDATKGNSLYRALYKIGWFTRKFIHYKLTYVLFANALIPGSVHKVSRKFLIQEAMKLGHHEFFAWYESIMNFYDEVSADEYVGKVPSLYIMGEKDTMFTGGVMKHMAGKDNVNVEMIESAGHIVNIDAYNEVNALSIEFINKVSEREEALLEAAVTCETDVDGAINI